MLGAKWTVLYVLLALTEGISDHFANFPPPTRLQLPMQTQFRQINSGGPPDPYPEAKAAISLPQISLDEPATRRILEDIREGLQYIFQTRNEWTIGIHGSGTTGAHTVLDNLIEPGDTVLVLITGYWGDLQVSMAKRLGAEVVQYSKAPGTRFSLSEIEAALRKHRPTILAMVRGESDTGVYQSLEGVGDLCIKTGTLLAVDDVAVAGIQPIRMDELKIDAIYSSSGKGIGAILGLALVSFSSRAVEKIKSRAIPPRAYQTDVALQWKLWDTEDPSRHIFQSMSLQALYSLREALARIVEEGMENTFKRHELTTMQLTRGMLALGMKHYVVNSEDRLTSIVTMLPPEGKDPDKITRYTFRNFNIELSNGFGPTSHQVVRVAIYGNNASPQRVRNILRALKRALESPETDIISHKIN